ncbi:MAG: hypothetical protein AAF927_20690 [Bacteroidota bacterium]
MKNLLLSLLALVSISITPEAQACEHSPLQHHLLLENYLQFPLSFTAIADCQYVDFEEGMQMIMLSLETPEAFDPFTHVIFLLTGDELIEQHQIESLELEDVKLEMNRKIPAFSSYSSELGDTEFYTFHSGLGFVPTLKIAPEKAKPLRVLSKNHLDYLPYDQIRINTFVGLDTKCKDLLFLLGQPDSITQNSFDILDEEARFFHYGQSVIKIVDKQVLTFELANEGDELARMVVGSSALGLAARFPYSFGERSVKEDGYVMRLSILNKQHQIGDYRFLSIYVQDEVISKISLGVNP